MCTLKAALHTWRTTVVSLTCPKPLTCLQVAKPGSAVVFWNCELDTLRGDLGLFGFPGKDVQYDFLSRCKPVFYVRQRDYSKTVSIAPFIVNYSGCLFREYPGPWQVMLRQDNGVYACVAEDSTRCAAACCSDDPA